MREIAGLVLAFGAVVSYYVLATGFGVYQRWPVVHYVLCLVALVILVQAIIRQSPWWRRGLAALALGVGIFVSALFAGYTLVMSAYAEHDPGFALGDDLGSRLAGRRVPGHDGTLREVFRPGADRATLLVFYRGFW